jgi:hypothetical protein
MKIMKIYEMNLINFETYLSGFKWLESLFIIVTNGVPREAEKTKYIQ